MRHERPDAECYRQQPALTGSHGPGNRPADTALVATYGGGVRGFRGFRGGLSGPASAPGARRIGSAVRRFFAFWSYAQFIHDLPAVQIYDVASLRAFQQTLPGGLEGYYPYLDPPILLLYLWPLGGLGYLPAAALWIGGSFGAYLAAVAGRDWRAPPLWLAVVAPTTVFSLISGENGFLTAALLIGGFRLIGRWPVLGGVILGGLAFKPQLFPLVPVALLAARQWRSLAGLAGALLGLAETAALAFGTLIWLRWVQAAPTLSPLVEANWRHFNHLGPTVSAAALGAGLGFGAAEGLQIAVTLGVVVCLWRVFRREDTARTPRRPLEVAAFLATPLCIPLRHADGHQRCRHDHRMLHPGRAALAARRGDRAGRRPGAADCTVQRRVRGLAGRTGHAAAAGADPAGRPVDAGQSTGAAIVGGDEGFSDLGLMPGSRFERMLAAKSIPPVGPVRFRPSRQPASARL